jgi:hypothetical protein
MAQRLRPRPDGAAGRVGPPRPAPRVAAGAIIAIGFAACLALNWPGHFTWDSVMQLAEGRRGVYSGQHPPVMSWLLGLADALGPGGALFMALDAALVFGALAAFAMLGRGSWAAVLLAAALAATPQLVIYPAIVWKDVLFAGAACGGFACLAWAAAEWDRPTQRWTLLCGALVLLALATLARQNGAVVLPFAALALWRLAGRAAPIRARIAVGGGYLALSAALVFGASLALGTRVTGQEGVAAQWEHLQTYDIVGVAARDPALRLQVLSQQAPKLEALLREEGAPAYSPSRIDTLADPVFAETDPRPGLARPIAAQWRALILHHPLAYLRQRAAAFGWVLLTPKPAECVMVETGVDGDPAPLAAAGLTERMTPRDKALESYAEAFTATPVYSHALYGAAALVFLVILLRRGAGPDVAVAAMLGAALTFAATFVVISIACDYRYLYFLDLSAIAAALYLAAGPRATRPN